MYFIWEDMERLIGRMNKKRVLISIGILFILLSLIVGGVVISKSIIESSNVTENADIDVQEELNSEVTVSDDNGLSNLDDSSKDDVSGQDMAGKNEVSGQDDSDEKDISNQDVADKVSNSDKDQGAKNLAASGKGNVANSNGKNTPSNGKTALSLSNGAATVAATDNTAPANQGSNTTDSTENSKKSETKDSKDTDDYEAPTEDISLYEGIKTNPDGDIELPFVSYE